jgi:hypothetical protein
MRCGGWNHLTPACSIENLLRRFSADKGAEIPSRTGQYSFLRSKKA